MCHGEQEFRPLAVTLQGRTGLVIYLSGIFHGALHPIQGDKGSLALLGIAADEELEFVAAFKNDLYNENLTLTMIAGQNPFAEGETQLQMTRSYG